MKLLLTTLLLSFLIQTNNVFAQSTDQELVQKVVQSAYIDGIQNLGEISAIEKGFHPAFEMVYVKDGNVVKFPIGEWIEGVKKRKADAATKPILPVTGKFIQVDLTGSVAVAKVELYREGKMIFTDYLSLYKFADGWRIVSKVFHRH